MGEKKKVGVHIDKSTWRAFQEYVEEKHGKTYGLLGREVERALEARMNGAGDSSVEEKLTRVESKLNAVLETDADGSGGTPLPDDSDGEVRARADSRSDGSDDAKPAANQPRGQKADWVAARVRSKASGQAYTRTAIATIVRNAWGFEDDTVADLVDLAMDRLGAEQDPRPSAADVQVAWGETLEAARREAAQAARDDVRAEGDRLDAATPEDD